MPLMFLTYLPVCFSSVMAHDPRICALKPHQTLSSAYTFHT